ncbi:MAG: ABC transporter permease, partial [Bacteroidales bacterium]|nr:ABC transporter permease [Bacteroidales bacterium]
ILRESFIIAFSTLKINRLRTFLTLLGITIGIFAIISVFTVVDSLERSIRTSLSSLGDDIIYIQKWPWVPPPGEEYKWWDYLKRPLPTINEFEQIQKRSKKSSAVVFSISGLRNVQYRNTNAENIIVWANSHDFEKIRSFDIKNGRYFTRFESISGKNVAILGNKIADDLFQGINPVGKKIKIQGRHISIIGVLKKEGKNALVGGGSLDEVVLLTINYAKKLVDFKKESANPLIMVKSKKNASKNAHMDELRGILRSTRTIKPSEKDNFSLNQANLITKSLDQIFSIINIAGWLIGGFSILVGGFGIANIMFVSVKERTHNIGIQKSLGAKRKFILLQFLFESILLSLIGGAIGLFLIYFGSLIANAKIDLEIILTGNNILLGLFISVIIGVISGFAPARAAAKLNPVEAINSSF